MSAEAAVPATPQQRPGPAEWIIAGVVVLIGVAIVVNAVKHTNETHRFRADKAIFFKWAAAHGGRSTWSRPVVKQRSTLDTACSNHLLANHAARPDYRICLYISRRGGPATIVKTAKGPPRKVSVLENTGQAGPG